MQHCTSMAHTHTHQQPLDLSLDYKFIICQSVGHSLSLQRTAGNLSGQVSLEDAWPAPHQRQDHRHVRVDVCGHCVEWNDTPTTDPLHCHTTACTHLNWEGRSESPQHTGIRGKNQGWP